MKKEISSKITALIFGVIVILFLAGFYSFAWDEPSDSPSGGNVAAPLNAGSVGQSKTGALRLGGLTVDYDTILAALGGNVNVSNKRIINVATPQSGTDAVNRDYVDALGGGGSCDYPALVMTISEYDLANTATEDYQIKFTTAKYSKAQLYHKGLDYINQLCENEFGDSYKACNGGTTASGDSSPDNRAYYGGSAGGNYSTDLASMGLVGYSASYDDSTFKPSGVSVAVSYPSDCSTNGYPWILASVNSFMLSGDYTCVAMCSKTKSVLYKYGSNLFMLKNTFSWDWGSIYNSGSRSLTCCPD